MLKRHVTAGLTALALSTTALALAPSAAHAADALAWLPADTAMVLSVDVAGLQKTEFYTEAMGYLRQEDEFAEMVREMRDNGGFDLEKDLERIVLAVPADADTSENFLVVAEGMFDAEKIVSAFEKESSETLTVTKHEGQTYWGFESSGAVLFDGDVMLFGTKASVKAAIEAAKSGKSALAKPLTGLLKGTDRTANIWWIGAFPDMAKQIIGSQVAGGDEFETFHGSLDFSSGMALKTTVGLASSGAAKGMHELASAALAEVSGDATVAAMGMDTALSKTQLAIDGTEVSISLTLDPTEFAAFKTALLQMFFGMSASSSTSAVPPAKTGKATTKTAP